MHYKLQPLSYLLIPPLSLLLLPLPPTYYYLHNPASLPGSTYLSLKPIPTIPY